MSRKTMILAAVVCLALLGALAWRPDFQPSSRTVEPARRVASPLEAPAAEVEPTPEPVAEAEPRVEPAAEVDVVPPETAAEILADAEPLVEAVARRIAELDDLESRLDEQGYALIAAEEERKRAEQGPAEAQRSLQYYRQGPVRENQRFLESVVDQADRELKWIRYHARWSEVINRNTKGAESTDDRQAIAGAEKELARATGELRQFLATVEQNHKAALDTALRAAQAEIVYRREVLGRQQAIRDDLLRQREAAALSEVERKAVVALDDAVRLANSSVLVEARSRLDEARRLWEGESQRRSNARAGSLMGRITDAASAFRTPPEPHSP